MRQKQLRQWLHRCVLGLSGVSLAGLLVSFEPGPALRGLGSVAEAGPELPTRFETLPWRQLSYPHAGSLSDEEIHAILKKKMTGVLSRREIRLLATQLSDLCRESRFDPAFVLAVMAVESGFQPRAVSVAGAMGLMQIMPATAMVVAARYGVRYLGPQDLFNPLKNLRIGIGYLAELRGMFSSVVPHFLAAYNAGPWRIQQLLARKEFRPSLLKKYVDDVLKALGPLRSPSEFGDPRA